MAGGESDAESDGEKGQIAGWQEAERDRAAAVNQSAARPWLKVTAGCSTVARVGASTERAERPGAAARREQ